MARRQRLRADPQPDGRRSHRGNLALAGMAVDPLAEGRTRRRPQGDRRARARIHEGRAGEREALGRRQHSAVRAGRGDLRTDVDVGRLHRIPDAAAVRGNLTARPDPAGSGRRRQAAAGRATRRPAGPGAPRGAFFSLAA
ncbi:Exonuclease SbcC [Burkholderia vietnamiensis]|nr:Exonuclease SbcC [Burkholderia vietnamiensis]